MQTLLVHRSFKVNDIKNTEQEQGYVSEQE